jgi:hypothetical protein
VIIAQKAVDEMDRVAKKHDQTAVNVRDDLAHAIYCAACAQT